MASTTDYWGPIAADVGAAVDRRIGGISVRARREADEWLLAHSYDSAEPDDLFADDPAWTRYVTVAGDPLTLEPALPDRPVLIRPRSPIVILPGRWGRFYFSVPLWLRFVSESEGKQVTMTELPSQSLSSTWFGDMQTGELCYAIDSRLLRSAPDEDDDEAFARCEVEIRNSSPDKLQFERISVHVQYMNLYSSNGRFWSNKVEVLFKGADQVSQLSYRPDPPEQLTRPTKVCEPREVLDRNIFKRSFNLIREITGI